jgi:hypothetical protein
VTIRAEIAEETSKTRTSLITSKLLRDPSRDSQW